MTWRTDALAHAMSEGMREACGLVVIRHGREIYWPCRNVADTDEHFLIAPADYVAAEDAGEVIAVVHSHPGAPATPSEADRAGCEASRLPWHIVSTPCGHWYTIEPRGFTAPLVGRVFQHGTVDCYSLIRDWYRQERGVVLPDFHRAGEWWLRGESLYLDHFGTAGFVEWAGAPEVGDVLLMQILSPVPNHGAIYVGDGMVLHHLYGRLSSRDDWCGYLRKHTVKTLRYAQGNQALR